MNRAIFELEDNLALWSAMAKAACLFGEHKEGCVLVTAKGIIISGHSGVFNSRIPELHSGEELTFRQIQENNQYNYYLQGVNFTREDEYISATRNVLDKAAKLGLATEGAHLFITKFPDFESAKSIDACGIVAVHSPSVGDDTPAFQYLGMTHTIQLHLLKERV